MWPQRYGSLSIRISVTLIVQSLVFVVTIILAVVDSTEWPEIFFWVTMLSAVVINIANGVYQGCVYGAAAKLPMEYTNAVTIGMNLSGTIASLFMIMSIAVSPSPKVVAIIFFSCAVIILTLCLITEFFLKNNVRNLISNLNEQAASKKQAQILIIRKLTYIEFLINSFIILSC